MPDSKPVIHIAALLTVEDQHLLAVRKHGSNLWQLPGGKIEGTEHAELALQRELQEELGVMARKLQYLGHFRAPAANEAGHEVWADIFIGELFGHPHAAAEIAEMRWLSTQGTAAPLAPLLQHHVIPAWRRCCEADLLIEG